MYSIVQVFPLRASVLHSGVLYLTVLSNPSNVTGEVGLKGTCQPRPLVFTSVIPHVIPRMCLCLRVSKSVQLEFFVHVLTIFNICNEPTPANIKHYSGKKLFVVVHCTKTSCGGTSRNVDNHGFNCIFDCMWWTFKYPHLSKHSRQASYDSQHTLPMVKICRYSRM